MIRNRKKAGVGFVAGVLVLAAASVASACTVWVGQFTVETARNADNDRDDAYERVTTYGLGTGMNHCWMHGAIKVHVGSHTTSNIAINYKALDLQTPAEILADPTNPANGATAACAAAATRAPQNGWYTISYLNTGFADFAGGNVGGGLTDATWEVDRRLLRPYVRDCMAVGGATSRWNQQSGSSNDLEVLSGVGNWSGQIRSKPSTSSGGTEIADLPGTESAICVQQAPGYVGAPDGGQAPIIVI